MILTFLLTAWAVTLHTSALQDADIEQPADYIPHDPPGEPAEETAEPVEEVPEPSPPEETPGEALEEIPAPEESSPELSMDSDPYLPYYTNLYDFQDDGPQQDGAPVIGYSSDSELLAGINAGVNGIFFCLILLMSCGFVYLFCRIVWPLFSSF